jgi:hypothetical protein
MKTVVYASGLAALSMLGCRDRDRVQPGVISEADRKALNDQQDKSGTTTITGANFVGADAATDRIVASRCARELTCSNVGPDKHFKTTDACVVEVRKGMRTDFDTTQCTSGIDGAALDKCLDSIRSESCTNPIDTLSRMAACRTGALCARAEMPHR